LAIHQRRGIRGKLSSEADQTHRALPGWWGTDIAARWLGQKLSEALHQQIIVDNRAGADGNLGTNVIAKGAPDGYLIGMATSFHERQSLSVINSRRFS
jgi:hypothetical protein